MKAALALIFFTCIAGSMAKDAQVDALAQIIQQGQNLAQTVMNQLQQQILAMAQQTVDHLQSLIASIGGRSTVDLNELLNQLQTTVQQLANQALTELLSGLQGLIGGMEIAFTKFYLFRNYEQYFFMNRSCCG